MGIFRPLYFIEFVFLDTNRLTGEMEQRLTEACDIVRKITNRPEGRRQKIL